MNGRGGWNSSRDTKGSVGSTERLTLHFHPRLFQAVLLLGNPGVYDVVERTAAPGLRQVAGVQLCPGFPWRGLLAVRGTPSFVFEAGRHNRSLAAMPRWPRSKRGAQGGSCLIEPAAIRPAMRRIIPRALSGQGARGHARSRSWCPAWVWGSCRALSRGKKWRMFHHSRSNDGWGNGGYSIIVDCLWPRDWHTLDHSVVLSGSLVVATIDVDPYLKDSVSGAVVSAAHRARAGGLY